MSSIIKDRHKTTPFVLNSPIKSAAAVTPSDSADLAEPSMSLYIGGAGALKVTLISGDTVTYAAIAAGRHPLRATRVWATGTTATGIVSEV